MRTRVDRHAHACGQTCARVWTDMRTRVDRHACKTQQSGVFARKQIVTAHITMFVCVYAGGQGGPCGPRRQGRHTRQGQRSTAVLSENVSFLLPMLRKGLFLPVSSCGGDCFLQATAGLGVECFEMVCVSFGPCLEHFMIHPENVAKRCEIAEAASWRDRRA
jgi:hypothetical protein